MGCRQTMAAYDKRSIENEKLEKFENNLGFKLNESSVYEGILSRFANSSLTSSQIIESFQKFSKIQFPDPLKDEILNTFVVNEKFDLKAFQCFCILLSKSSEQDKGEALWYTFDNELKNVLLGKTIKVLIETIVRSSVNVTLQFAIKSAYYDTKKFSDWKNHLRDRTESLETRLVKHFTQGKESVSKEEFLLRLQDRPEGLVTTFTAIRSQLEHTQVIPNKFANPFKNMKVTKLTG